MYRGGQVPRGAHGSSVAPLDAVASSFRVRDARLPTRSVGAIVQRAQTWTKRVERGRLG
jgi:hypothetical protein